jgi:hypothetical protein
MEHDAVDEDLIDPITGSIPVFFLEISQKMGSAHAGLVLRRLDDLTFMRLGVFRCDWRNPFVGDVPNDGLPIPPGISKADWDAKRQEQYKWFDQCEPQIITII